MQAKHALRVGRGSGDLVRVQVARIGGEDGVGPDDLVQAAEEIDLHVEIVEHRLDHKIAGRKIGIGCRDREAAFLRVKHRLVDPPGGQVLLKKPENAFATPGRCLIVAVKPDHAIAGTERSDGDAASHQAEADDADRLDGARGNTLQILNLRCLPFRKEYMAQCGRLAALAELEEGGPLVGHAFGERPRGRFHEADGLGGGLLPACLGKDPHLRLFDGGAVGYRNHQLAGPARVTAGKPSNCRKGCLYRAGIGDFIDQAKFVGFLRLHAAAAADQVD